MATKIASFKDLEFQNFSFGCYAEISFGNGYMLSVNETKFDGNVDRYSVAIFYNGFPFFDSGIMNDILVGCSVDSVNRVMKYIQLK